MFTVTINQSEREKTWNASNYQRWPTNQTYKIKLKLISEQKSRPCLSLIHHLTAARGCLGTRWHKRFFQPEPCCKHNSHTHKPNNSHMFSILQVPLLLPLTIRDTPLSVLYRCCSHTHTHIWPHPFELFFSQFKGVAVVLGGRMQGTNHPLSPCS